MAGTKVWIVDDKIIPKDKAKTPEEAAQIAETGYTQAQIEEISKEKFQPFTPEQQEEVRKQQRAKTLIPREGAVRGLSGGALSSFLSKATPEEQAQLTRGTRYQLAPSVQPEGREVPTQFFKSPFQKYVEDNTTYNKLTDTQQRVTYQQSHMVTTQPEYKSFAGGLIKIRRESFAGGILGLSTRKQPVISDEGYKAKAYGYVSRADEFLDVQNIPYLRRIPIVRTAVSFGLELPTMVAKGIISPTRYAQEVKTKVGVPTKEMLTISSEYLLPAKER